MKSIRLKRALSLVLSCALCITMNGIPFYAEELVPTENETVSESAEVITEVSEAEIAETELDDESESVSATEAAVMEETEVEEVQILEESTGAAGDSVVTLSADVVNHIIYLSDNSVTIRETDGKTLLEIENKTVSYNDLSGNSVSGMSEISQYTVAAGRPEGELASGDVEIKMESGSVQGIIGSYNSNGTGALRLLLEGGSISGNGVLLVKGNGAVKGNAVIRVDTEFNANKIDTRNNEAGHFAQTTIAQSKPMEVIGSGTDSESFIFHENTVSTNQMIRTGVVNCIDFHEVSENQVFGTVSGNVTLCDTLTISTNEVLSMKQGKLTIAVNGKIQNNGVFELYRGAELLNMASGVVSGNNLVIREIDFTSMPILGVPADNMENQHATIAGGAVKILGNGKNPVTLVEHGSLSGNTSISVNTTIQAGKGRYSYSYSYASLGTGICFSPDVVLYDNAGKVVSGNQLPDEMDTSNGALKLIFYRYIGSTQVVLRLNRGGAIYATLNIPFGSNGQALENLIRTETGGMPEIEGRTFGGWYAIVGEEEKSIYDNGFEISESIKNLYAKWLTADQVILAIRDFEDGTLVRRQSVFGDTFLSDTNEIDYSRDFYQRIGTDVYKEQQTSPLDDGDLYGTATRVSAVTSVSDNVYTVYAKYEFDATVFNDEEGSDFSFKLKKKAKVLEEDGEPVVAYNYTGRQIQPEVIVKNGKTTLKENDDYVLRFEDNIDATGNAANAKVIIEGRGIYTGSVTLGFAILPKSIKSVKIGVVGNIPLEASESEYQERIVVMDDEQVVDPGDYEMVFVPKMGPDGETAIPGKGKIRVYGGGGNYIENEKVYVSKTVNFISTEGKTDLSSFRVNLSQQQYTYNGKLIKPSARVGNATVELEAGKDYKLVYQDNQNVGKDAKVYAVGCGKYYGITQAAEFEITQRELKRVQIRSIGSVTYTGSQITNLKLRVSDGKNILVEGVDYTVSFNDTEENKNVSTGAVRAKITIEAVKNAEGEYIGNYRGVKNATFKIKRRNINNSNAVKVYKDEYSWSYSYTGSAIKPVVGLSYGGVMLEEGKDYTVTYKNNVKSFMTTGKIASLTIKGKNNFTGSRTFMFFIF